jgi:hypothetical protein
MRRHELDLFSLIAGLAFVAVAAGHLLDVGTDLEFDGRWVAPIVLVTLGLAGLVGVLGGRGEASSVAAADSGDRTTAVDTEPAAAEEGEGTDSR